jgi:hypothetical protein
MAVRSNIAIEHENYTKTSIKHVDCARYRLVTVLLVYSVLATHSIRPYFSSLLYITLPVNNRDGDLRWLLAASVVYFLRMNAAASAVI